MQIKKAADGLAQIPASKKQVLGLDRTGPFWMYPILQRGSDYRTLRTCLESRASCQPVWKLLRLVPQPPGASICISRVLFVSCKNRVPLSNLRNFLKFCVTVNRRFDNGQPPILSSFAIVPIIVQYGFFLHCSKRLIRVDRIFLSP
jgi:hypothetical protein